MTPAQLATLTPEEAQAWGLCEAATPGPLIADLDIFDPDECEIEACVSNKDPMLLLFTSGTGVQHIGPTRKDRAEQWSRAESGQTLKDARFFANARTALPAALETIATLRADLARVTQERDYYASISEKP